MRFPRYTTSYMYIRVYVHKHILHAYHHCITLPPTLQKERKKWKQNPRSTSAAELREIMNSFHMKKKGKTTRILNGEMNDAMKDS